MSELSYLVKEIEKKKNLEINLPKYMSAMMSSYHRYSTIRLALNYYTYYEIVKEREEDDERPESIIALAGQVNQVIEQAVSGDLTPKKIQECIEKADALRKQITSAVRSLTTYTDAFQIYEYVLNRVEYRFQDDTFSLDYSDAAFAKKIMEYVLSDRDNVVVNGKILEVVGQLPVRMTRKRYFEILKDSFSMYQGAEKSAMEDFMYMLRTVSMLEKPEGEQVRYENLAAILKRLSEEDYDKITKERHEVLLDDLEYVAGYVLRMTNLCMMMEEVVNDVYVILLSMPYAITDLSENTACRQIITEVCRQMRGDGTGTMEEAFFEKFESLEGKQERIYEQITMCDYLIDALKDEKVMLEGLMLDKIYYSLQRIMKLASNSIFIDLDRVRNQEEADEKYVRGVRDAFIGEISEQFRCCPKLINRSVMAATLQILPIFFGSLNEFAEYILYALENCSDASEKLASVRLLEEIIWEG